MRLPFRPTDEERKLKEEKRQKARDERDEKDYARRQEKLDKDVKRTKQTYNYKSLLERFKFETYTKRLVGIIVAVGLIDLQLSYVLAFFDKVEIAETLSTQICTTILGTALIYMIRAYFDTKAEKSDERELMKQDAESKILDQVRTTLYDAGVDIPSDVEKFAKFESKSSDSDSSEVTPPVPVPEEEVTEGVSEEEIAEAKAEEEDSDSVG